MRIPRYWAQGRCEYTAADGRPEEFACWGWSNNNREEAAERGLQRAEKAVEQLLRGDLPDRYLYSDRPLREEIVQEFTDNDGELQAAITRNGYGCHVLNTARLPFIDRDAPRPNPVAEIVRFLRSLFGRAKAPSPWDLEAGDRREELVSVLERYGYDGVRLYRTKAGERYLLTGTLLDPTATNTFNLMEDLGSDPVYQKLCRVQECFRARLTPKPWRCGVAQPPVRFPWKTEQDQQKHRRWEEAYFQRADRYATCQFVEHLGDSSMSDDVRALVELHDELTRANADLPLA